MDASRDANVDEQRVEQHPEGGDKDDGQQQLNEQWPAGSATELREQQFLQRVGIGFVTVEHGNCQQPEIENNQQAHKARHGKEQGGEKEHVSASDQRKRGSDDG